MGILPNLITGRSIKKTVKNTVGMIKDNAMEIFMIRIGYSVFCWIVAILTYVAVRLGDLIRELAVF